MSGIWKLVGSMILVLAVGCGSTATDQDIEKLVAAGVESRVATIIAATFETVPRPSPTSSSLATQRLTVEPTTPPLPTPTRDISATIVAQVQGTASANPRPSPTSTPRPSPTPIPTPRPTPTPSVIDDYGNDRSAAVAVGFTTSDPSIRITGSLETPRDVDTLSFQGLDGESFVIAANYLLRGSIVDAIGHPKLVLYSSSPSTPLAIDDGWGDLFYRVLGGGTIYLDVSAYSSKLTSDYQIVVYRNRSSIPATPRPTPTAVATPIPTPTPFTPTPTPICNPVSGPSGGGTWNPTHGYTVTVPEGWSLTTSSDDLWTLRGAGNTLETSGLYAIYGYSNVTESVYAFHDTVGLPLLYSYLYNHGLYYSANVGVSRPGVSYGPSMVAYFEATTQNGGITSFTIGCHGFVLLYAGWASVENIGGKATIDSSFFNSLH